MASQGAVTWGIWLLALAMPGSLSHASRAGHIRFAAQGGGELPALAFGTAKINESEPIAAALHAGYRHIDTALLYGSHKAVGEALRSSGLPRSDVFLTTKVSFLPGDLPRLLLRLHDWAIGLREGTSALLGKGNERAALRQSLHELGISQVDLCLLHSPVTGGVSEFFAAYLPHRLGRWKPVPSSWLRRLGAPVRWLLRSSVAAFGVSGAEARRRAWAELEEAQAAGDCRFIGVSNYDVGLLRELEASARVRPAVNQIEFHPRFQARETAAYCREHGIAIMAYGTSVSMGHKVVAEVAVRQGLSAPQVSLRWVLQQGSAAVVQSKRIEGLKQNLATLEAEAALSTGDMKALDSLDEGMPFIWDPSAVLRSEEPHASGSATTEL